MTTTMSRHHGRLRQVTDGIADDFFDDAYTGNLVPDTYAAFLQDDRFYGEMAADSFYRAVTNIVMDEHFETPVMAPTREKLSMPNACNGAGLSGVIVRFTTKNIDEARAALAKIVESSV